jgi:hypothetical protein
VALEERPFVTHSQRREYLKAAAGVWVSRSTICRAIARIAKQKVVRYATERDEFKRAAWRVTVAEHTDARNLVFVDEMGTHTSLAPLYGYSPCGERVHLEVPRNREDHHPTGEHEPRGHGGVPGCGGGDHESGLRGLRREGVGTHSPNWTAPGNGQTSGSQRREDREADRGTRLQAALSAALLIRLQPNRRGVCQDQEPPTQSCSQKQEGSHRCTGRGPLVGKSYRCSRFLRACWLPYGRPTTVKRAVRGQSSASSRG